MRIIPSQQLIDIIIKAEDKASSVAEKVDSNLKKMGNSTGLLGKVPGLSTLRTKLSGISTTIKSKVEPAINSARQKLTQLSNGAKGLGSVLGPLKSALSMTAGMIGYDLVNGLVQSARASINASSQLDYFGKRLNMSASETTKFRSELDGLQKEFRKVDMTAVGATAEEMAVKFNLPKKSLSDLTRMTAVLSSTFVKEGRTQEDAILAVSDALDGQFKRLQEIGITQDTLMQNGWNGNIEDQDSLIQALNKSMQEMGYEQTAKDITNLDEAWTALTIAGGQLLQKVLVPITPVIVQVIEALLKVADAAGPVINAFINFVSNMPDWAKYAGLVGAFAIAVNVVAGWITATLVPALAAAALAALDFAAAMLANPLTWVAIALAAVAIAIYEVGKAFGWWTDVNSMLSAVWAGIQRLWSAFINHPDVQAIIATLTECWNVLSGAIGGVINWVSSFFTISSGGEFDVVRALIDSLSLAWQVMTLPIRLVIQAVQTVLSVFQGVVSGQINILNAIIGVWNTITSFLSGIFSLIIANISSWAVNIAARAISGAINFTNGIINNIKSLPSKFLAILVTVRNYIINQITNWINRVKTGAKNLVTGFINNVKSLPGKAYTQLLQVASRITTAGSKWVSNARTQAQRVVDGAYNRLTSLPGRAASALSGLVNSIVKPFRDAYNKAKEWWNKISSLGTSGGAAGFDYLGMIEELQKQNSLDLSNSFSSGVSEESSISIDHNINFLFDFANLPSGISEEQLVSMLRSAVNDKSVINALVNNPDFQSLDSKVKNKILLKNNRARGV